MTEGGKPLTGDAQVVLTHCVGRGLMTIRKLTKEPTRYREVVLTSLRRGL